MIDQQYLASIYRFGRPAKSLGRKKNTLMRPRISIALLFLLGFPVLAAADTKVAGKIVSATSALPLESAVITLFFSGSEEPLAVESTDSNGRYLFESLQPGIYKLKVDLPRYQSYVESVFVGERSTILKLEDINMTESTDALEEILVTAQGEKANVSIDRRVYLMEDNLTQSGGNLLEALKSLPGVTVEENGKVRIRGSDRVVVMVDGKQSAVTGYSGQSGLESIPLGNVESIEVINNPSARYDASGAAGIINIVYRKTSEVGLSGDYGITGAIGVLSQRQQDLPTEMGSMTRNPKISPTLNLNYLSEGVRAFAQGELVAQEALPNNEFSLRQYDDGKTIVSQVPENRKQVRVILRSGADINLTSKSQLSISAVFDRESHEDNAQVPFIDVHTGEWIRYWFWKEKEVTGFASASANFIYGFTSPGHQIEASLEYIAGWEDESYFVNEVSPIREGTDATFLSAKEYTLPFNISYVRPLAFGRLEVGGRIQKRWIPVKYEIDQGEGSILYPGLGESTKWAEDIGSVYTNFILETEKTVVEAGLRAEQTEVAYEIDDNNIYYDRNDKYNYFKSYPSIRLIRDLKNVVAVSVAFNRRVDRPGEPELRIFPKVDDPELMKVGNPYLRPEFTDNWEVGLEKSWNTGSAVFSFYYRDIEDSFRRIYSIDESNENYDIVNRTYQNTGREKNTGIEVIWSQDFADSLRLTGSISAYQIEIESFQGEVLFPVPRPFFIEATSDNTWDGKISLSSQLPWELEAQATFVYYDDRTIAQGYRLARSSLDIGIRKVLKNINGEITFSATDLLNDFGLKEKIRGVGLTTDYSNYFETQVLRLSVKVNI